MYRLKRSVANILNTKGEVTKIIKTLKPLQTIYFDQHCL